MDYDTMTIESLAHDCFIRSGYAINRADLITRITHLCENHKQSLPIDSVSEPLEIYMTYDRHDGEVLAAFTSKGRCELESEECQTPMQQTNLYFGERK